MVADLTGANLMVADLTGTDFTATNLSMANLNGANLSVADLNGANLGAANFHKVFLYETALADVDLSAVTGLQTCFHGGPSIIDYRTLQRSGRLPLAFCVVWVFQSHSSNICHPC